MASLFEAGCVYSSDDGEVVIVGFADSQFDTKRYVLLQRGKHPSGEDRALGHDQVHITVDDESHSNYGGIRTIELEPGLVRISLEPNAARLLGTDREIVIRFVSNSSEQAALVTRLMELFAE